MSFVIYDLILLAAFAIFIGIFLYRGRKNLKKDGLLLLYRTQWGTKLIEKVGTKYKKTLYYLSYVSIALGYILMAGMIWLFIRIVYIYIALPAAVREIKVPPIMPLIPYLPQVFKIDFLPPFYFIYWIVILAVIAIPHEFAHGIFMRRYGIKIKSTGFGFFPFFLPVFLAAFVEQDEKSMEKSTKFHQMAVLSAGTFANILTAILFFFVLWAFFAVAFTPAGVMFDSYSYSFVNKTNIESINGIQINSLTNAGMLEILNENENNIIKVGDREFILTKELWESQANRDIIAIYDSAPAVKGGIDNTIISINGEKISSQKELSKVLSQYSPGENVSIVTKTIEGTNEYEVTLEEHPQNSNQSWLGIGFFDRSGSGILGKVFLATTSFKKPNTYYEPTMGEFSVFIYNLLWWLIIILISVALVNMLPVGIFDGGRFFYLTILGITGSEKAARRSFAALTYLFLLVLVVIMIFWGLSFR